RFCSARPPGGDGRTLTDAMSLPWLRFAILCRYTAPEGSIGRGWLSSPSHAPRRLWMSQDSELPKPAYKRVLLKLSGESFGRRGESGISMTEVAAISAEIAAVHRMGVQLAIVCGGGNILRGREFAAVSAAINPPTAHYMGMLATVINGLALQDALEKIG